MAINTLEYSKIFQKSLDKQLMQGATSGWMEQNAGQVQYHGGNEVKIPTISMQGMGNYDRDSGFVQGAVTLSYQTMSMTQDRGRTFQLDSMDVDETNFVANAGAVMGEFQRTQVIPEIDSYRYSKIFALAKAASKVTEGYTPAEATILQKLMEDIVAIEDTVGQGGEMVIIMSARTQLMLAEALKASRRLDIGDFKQGEISLKVKTFDEKPILVVPSARLKTLYKANDGKSGGQEAGGLVADSAAKDINWIILPRTTPLAISKQDKVRIFEPDMNQKADAWKLDYRRYHDLWIPKHRLDAVRASSK